MKVITEKSKIMDVLERGVEEIIEKQSLKKKLESGKRLRIKLGIDPTGTNIHIGRAIQLWKLRAFQELGHQIVLIIGDFTALIGDASDKTSKRPILTEKQIKENMKGYKKQIGKILDLNKVEFRHNSEWLKKIKLKELISIAQNFTAQQMIQRRNFKERWQNNNPIGLQELLYPIMQGYDSVAIKADVEIGGSDQLFNLKAGRIMQRLMGQPAQDILTTKMLFGLDGRKMSTSWNNVITILDKPEDMFGKIMSMKDEMIIHYFELTTRTSKQEIEEFKKSLNPKDLKMILAKRIVSLYWGEKNAKKAEEEFKRIFQEKKVPLNIKEIKLKAEEMPILELLFQTKLVESKKQAKRLIEEKAVKIEEQVITDWKKNIVLKDGMVIQVGKRRFIKILK